jgi:iron complex outermembrane receptor protein
MKTVKFLFYSCLFFVLMPALEAQTILQGSVKDKETNEPMTGVSIIVEGKVDGTVTDLDGNFYLLTKQIPPFILEFSFIGYERRRIEIVSSGQEINLSLSPSVTVGTEVIVAASRIEEGMLRSPITIEKLDGIELRSTPTPNAYGALANLRGVQMNTSSLTFTSVNTRGFADIQNWRFIQAVDGMEMNAPGLNYPVGAISAPPDIDIASMELVPGAGSALYGANAFNGMLLINSKDPFLYQGFSADVKGGITVQDAAGVNPFGMVEMRYATSYKNKLAFKIAASAMSVHDWVSNDTSFHITNTIAASGTEGLYEGLDRYDPAYSAVNIYGDESSVFVFLGDTSLRVNRTGYREADLLSYDQQVFKGNASLHYRINSDMEVSYDFRMLHADAILRHTTIYPMRNLMQQIHKAQLKGTNFDAKVYYSTESSGDSYYLLGTGAFLQRNLKTDADWGADYGAAYRGEVTGVPAGDHQAARIYADRDMPGPGTPEFQELLDSTLNNADFLTGGSKFVDRSSFVHAEANYDFTPHWDVVSIQAGGSFRNYWLNSQGTLFNDGENGFNEPIPIHEFGGYVQASKALFDDHLSLRASARFDKNQNFKGRFTPRASALISLGEERNHNIRMSYQTGFRNPATQEAFIALDVRQAILLGGLRRNLENYDYVLPADNSLTGAPAGTAINGTTIHDGLVSLASFSDFISNGLDTSLLVYLDLPYLQQEQVSTYELGYRTLLMKNRLYIDAFGYYNVYRNFVTRVDAYNVETLRAFGMYTNIEDDIWSIGAGASVEYVFPGDYKFGVNYTYTTFDADEAVANNPGFLPSFNTPEHRANLTLSNRNAWNNLGFSVKYRWSDGYTWQSPFGQGKIDAFHTLDAALMYQIPSASMNIKVGGTNLLLQEYQQVYGGPMIGSQIYIGITYDPVIYRNKVSKTKLEKKSKKKEDNNGGTGFGRF